MAALGGRLSRGAPSQAALQLSLVQKTAIAEAHKVLLAKLIGIYTNYLMSNRAVSAGLSSPVDCITRVRGPSVTPNDRRADQKYRPTGTSHHARGPSRDVVSCHCPRPKPSVP